MDKEVHMLRKRRNKKTEMLRRLPLFSASTDAELRRIGSLVDELHVEAGRELVTEGRTGHECFVIVRGTASVTVDDRQVATRGPGDFIGELALIDHEPRCATITAQTPMHVLVLDPRSFATLLENFPGVARRIFKGISERLRAAEEAPRAA